MQGERKVSLRLCLLNPNRVARRFVLAFAGRYKWHRPARHYAVTVSWPVALHRWCASSLERTTEPLGKQSRRVSVEAAGPFALRLRIAVIAWAIPSLRPTDRLGLGLAAHANRGTRPGRSPCRRFKGYRWALGAVIVSKVHLLNGVNISK